MARRFTHVLSSVLLAAPLAFIGCADEEVNRINVVFGDSGGGIKRGFLCRAPGADTALGLRAVIAGQVSFVFDLVGTGGIPSCREAALGDWCRTRGCAVLPDRRVCTEVPLEVTVEDLMEQADVDREISRLVSQLSGQLVTSDAPSNPVLVRAVATTQPCSALGAGVGFDCGALVGCAYSCPVVLTELEGDLVLDLDVRSTNCAPEVLDCATFERPGACPEP